MASAMEPGRSGALGVCGTGRAPRQMPRAHLSPKAPEARARALADGDRRHTVRGSPASKLGSAHPPSRGQRTVGRRCCMWPVAGSLASTKGTSGERGNRCKSERTVTWLERAMRLKWAAARGGAGERRDGRGDSVQGALTADALTRGGAEDDDVSCCCWRPVNGCPVPRRR